MDDARGADVARQRLQKLLARAGVGSRRACEELIDSGRVTVNGETAKLGDRADPLRDKVELDGIPVVVDPTTVVYLLHKPAGVVSTASDTHGRPAVTGLVPHEPRVFPVGRLDIDTEGLILLTNDGDLANRVSHPRFGVDKTYLADVAGVPSDSALTRLRRGVDLEDGVTSPAKVRLRASTQARSALEITIHEGRNRQVRRMCEAVGHPVERLVRTRIGPIADPTIEPGQWRTLTREEIRSLYQATGQPRRGQRLR